MPNRRAGPIVWFTANGVRCLQTGGALIGKPEVSRDHPRAVLCDYCGEPMVRHEDEQGEFWACKVDHRGQPLRL